MTRTAEAFGTPIEIAEMRDSAPLAGDPIALRDRMEVDGYLLLRGLLDREDVLAARAQIVETLIAVDESDERGRATGRTSRFDLEDPARWMQDMCEHPTLRKVTHAGPIMGFWEAFLGEPVRTFDFVWMRAVRPGPATRIHVDNVFMNRGSSRLYTTWTPFGDTGLEMGPLALLPGSHADRGIGEWAKHDVDVDGDEYGMFAEDHATIASRLGLQWHSSDFRAGDVVAFSMHTAHCGLDNCTDMLRISTDTRYQPASDAVDERWVGQNPTGHHGRSYGAMTGVRPA